MSQTLTDESHGGLRAFYAEIAKSGPAMIRVAAVLGFLSFFGMAFVDPLLVSGPDLDHALTLRIGACLALAALFGISVARAFTVRFARPLAFVACILTGLTVVGLTFFTGGGDSDYHGALFIAMFGYAILPIPWRRYDLPVVYGGFLAAYVGIHVAFNRTGGTGLLVTHVALIIAAATIAIVLQQIVHRGRLREFVQRAELAAANRRLTALDEAKSRFFANLSHELRTPLTLTLAPLEAVLESARMPLSDGQRERIMLAQRNALRLLRLVDDLLALTRAEAAAMRLDIEPLDLAAMVKVLVEDITELAARKRIDLQFRATSVPVVEADPHLIERALLNVLGNAMKFVAEGGRVTLTVAPSRDANDDGVEVTVADDGIGIAANDLPRIFDRFYQADSGTNRKTGGTGIGLALVKEIVEAHGGRVSAASAPGVGTTIRVWLPRALPAERAATVRRIAAVPGAGLPEWHEAIRRDRRYRLQGIDDATERRVAPRPAPRGPAPTVLVVEDNHDMIRFLVALLAYDFNVISAQNGRDGLRFAMERRPDLIISDIMMPEMDGVEMVAELRKSPSTRHIPFIFLTARGEVEDRVAGRGGGADAYLTKPFKSEELLAAVDALLTRQTHMRDDMVTREDEILVFMASGIAERLGWSIEALTAAISPAHPALLAAPTPSAPASMPAGLPAGMDGTRLRKALDGLRALAANLERLVHAGTEVRARTPDVDFVIRHVIDNVRRQEGAAERVVVAELAAATGVEMDARELELVLEPIVLRALAVTPKERIVRITSTRAAEGLPGLNGMVQLSVEDEGPKLPTAHAERLFYPFYETGEGQDDGLAFVVARRLVLARGGAISVESAPGARRDGGSTIVIRLPAARVVGGEPS